MDAKTIDRIEELVLAAHSAEQLARTATTAPAVITSVPVQSIEHLMAGRARFRGRFSTTVLAEFVRYVNNLPEGAGFINPSSLTARVFHNLGHAAEPGHADWYSDLQLIPTAPYAALLRIEGQPQGQKAAVEWIEDWAEHLVAARIGGTEGEQVPITRAIAAIRELTIAAKATATHTDRDFGAARSAMEEVEARAQGGIPSHLEFRCVPYLGFEERTLLVRLSVLTGDKPMLVLRIVGREALEESLAMEFQSLLGAELDEDVPLILGTFSP